MAYSELIRNFNQTREYLREFYVYGFRKRSDISGKSARTYDNERRRIESWLGDYVRYNRTVDGKNFYISLDSRDIVSNPLYRAFKSKTFTNNDILMHFYVMDILAEDGVEWMALTDIMEAMMDRLSDIDDSDYEIEESLLRKKLKEYVELGLLDKKKEGRNTYYKRREALTDMDELRDAIKYFADVDPVGVIGSYLLDKYDDIPDYILMKHLYPFYALESEVLCSILKAAADGKQIEITMTRLMNGEPMTITLMPCRIYISVDNGREYVLGYDEAEDKMRSYRLDHILSVKASKKNSDKALCDKAEEEYAKGLWGVASNQTGTLYKVTMDVQVLAYEAFIVERLEREKRGGSVTKLDDNLYRFEAEVYDPIELLPWIRTFTGRIVAIRSDNEKFSKRVKDSYQRMFALYQDEEV